MRFVSVMARDLISRWFERQTARGAARAEAQATGMVAYRLFGDGVGLR